MASKHKALSVACVKTYQYFTSTLPNSGTYNILACVKLKVFDYFVLYLRVELILTKYFHANLAVIQQRKTRVTFIKFELLVIIERQVAFIVKSRLRFVSTSENIFAIHNILHFNAILCIFTALQQFEQHCIQSEIGVNPVVSMPISWHLGITQN